MHSQESIEPTSRVVVIGASGTMGRQAVDSLLVRSARVRVLSRSLDRVADLPSSVERVVGDSSNPADMVRALEGATSVFYVSPHADDEEALARNLAEAAAKTSTRIVFAGVHVDGRTRLSRALARTAYGLVGPHYRGKFRASEIVRRVPNAIVLLPSNFCQNDEIFRDAILEGAFPQPLGTKGINRVDVRDVGDAAARALLDASLPGGAYPVCGPASLSGPECAEVWARALGRQVRYTGDGDDWIRPVETQLEGRKRADFLATFRVLRKFAQPTDPEQLAATTTLLGRAPRSYAQYVHDTLRSWQLARAA